LCLGRNSCQSARLPVLQLHQRPDPHTEQTQAAFQIDPFQTLPCGFTDHEGVIRVRVQGLVPRHALKVVISELDANGFAELAFALHICRHFFAQLCEEGAQCRAVTDRMQVVFKRGFSADAHGFAVGLDRSVVFAVRRIM